ncbi:MAG: DUF6538 domain-containing protein [Syntrophobacteraceae bacterium]
MKTSLQSKNPSYLLHTRYGYYFRLRIPSDLARILQGTHLKISLLTGRKLEARKRALMLVSTAINLFGSIRLGKSMDYDEVKRVMRLELKKLVGMTTEWEVAIPKTRRDVLYDYYISQIKELEEALDENDFRLARVTALKIIEQEGWPAPEDSVEFKVICREFLKSSLQFSKIMAKRANNEYEYEETIFPPATEAKITVGSVSKDKDETESNRISELLPKFIEDLELRRKSESYCIDCRIVIGKVLIQVLGDIPVSGISTKAVDGFVGIMRKMPQNFTKKKEYRDLHPLKLQEMRHETTLGQSRIRTITFMLSSFFQFCIRKGEMKSNPVVKGMAGAKPKKRGSSWSVEDLYKIFRSNEYINDGFEEPYQFWIPLLGLFTGARHKELAQLYVEDIVLKGGIWGITIVEDPEDTDKSVKTETSIRFIPLHDFIVNDLGFIRYVEGIRKLNEKRVFYGLKKWKAKGYRGQSSKWFGEWTEKIGVKANGKTFHSFRHWFRTYLENHARLNAYDIAPLLGHSDQKLMTLNYGEVWETTLYDRIMKIDYKKDIGLDLSDLKKSRFARPTM